MSSKPTFTMPNMKKIRKMRQCFRMNSASSMSSISEDEILDVNTSEHSSLSSLTYLTNSSSSLHASLSGGISVAGGLVTQGPSQFETVEVSCHNAPKMPSRGANFVEKCNGSADSISLDELVDDTFRAGREWSEASPKSSKAVSMPVRHDSLTDDLSSSAELSGRCSDSSSPSIGFSGSSSGVSFYSSSSGADTFALHQAKARRAVPI